ncbi:MAG TPA: DinB family protein [Nocardioidaceae bacterium]|nr:DinB family protein [Nocardioidaceae bacterium]
MNTWSQLLIDQLDFYLQAHLLPRLAGLTDDEYFWEPVDGCWSVRRRDDGQWFIESSWPDPLPDPEPVTTIAWRLCHIGVEGIATRVSAYFGDGSLPEGLGMFDERHLPPVPGTAADAVVLLETAYDRWRGGLAELDDEQFLRPLGPVGENFADDPLAALVLHVSRETMHHGGEIGVLRDLYRAKFR